MRIILQSWRFYSCPMKSAYSLKTVLHQMRLLELARFARSVFYKLQDNWLQMLNPNGKFVRASNEAVVFVNYKDPNYRWYYGRSLFLEQEYRGFVELLNLGVPNVIVDIGAHWGIFPAMLDANFRKTPSIQRVVCIEPDPYNIKILKNTVSRIKNFEVIVIESAIGDSDSKIQAYRNGGTCLKTYKNDSSSFDLVVRAKKLETVLRETNINPLDITHIKIDVDGSEPSFFFGNRTWLQQFKPLIMAEYWAKGLEKHPRYAFADYWKLLQEDYNVFLCNYPQGTYSILGDNDVQKLHKLTYQSVANLLLIPKGKINIEIVKKILKC